MDGYQSDAKIDEEIKRLQEMKRLHQEDDDLMWEEFDKELNDLEGDLDEAEKKSWYKKTNCDEEDEDIMLHPTDKEMGDIVEIWKENCDYGSRLRKHIDHVVGDDIIVDPRLNYEHGAIVDHLRKSKVDSFVARVFVKTMGDHYGVIQSRWGTGYVPNSVLYCAGNYVYPGAVVSMVLKYSPLEKNSTHPFIGVYILNNWGYDGSGVTFEPENLDEFVEMDLKEAIEKHRSAVQ